MAVHTIHIFDRKGKTLFTKRYYPSNNTATATAAAATTTGSNNCTNENDSNHDYNEQQQLLSEQRKLVFGMVYSLREITKMLSPTSSSNSTSSNSNDTGLHSVRTGASTLHTYETNSGLRLCLYVTNYNPNSSNSSGNNNTSSDPQQQVSTKVVRQVLQYIYHELYIQCVTRSPMYTPITPNVKETNFESKLDTYLKSQSWFL